MKKIISLILASIMLMCIFTMPCYADLTVDFNVNIDFDVETKEVSFNGNISTTYGSKDITYYLLNPGSTQDDIPLAPVVAHYGQTKADKTSGEFSDKFRFSGDEGVYTLFVTSGNVLKAISIDTSLDISSSDSSQLSELYALDKELLDPATGSYKTITTLDVKDSFEAHRAELPDEMPVVKPAEIKGLYTIYVDVKNGDDATATGAIDSPYKTIKAAVAAHPPVGGMVLCLREGDYPASDAVNLSNVIATESSPFFITSYEGEQVNVVGGTNIDGNQFAKVTDSDVLQRLNPAAAGNILVADLKAMGVTDYGEISSSSSPVLFVGDSKYQIARWPNVELTGMMHIKDALGEELAAQYEDLNTGYTQSRGTGVIDCGVITTSMGSPCGNYRKYSKRATELNNAAGKVVSTDKGAEFCVEDIHPFSWVDTGNIWMYVSLHDEWTHDHVRVAEFNPETRSVRTASSNSWGTQYKAVNKFYYYNILEELDSPGEWFMDNETGKLYIYPATDINKEKVLFAASSSTMWTLSNCKNVIINGINFEHARGQALEIKGTNTLNTVVQNCTFDSVGLGVSFQGRYSGVINSEFTNVADDSIYLKGGSEADQVALIPSRQFAQNNKIYNSKGIVMARVGNIVSHNYLSNVIGSCLYFSASRESILEYNEVVAGPRETLDSGAIYLNGNQQFNRGNHVRYNYIHETGASIGSKIPQSIYFDDMASENYAYGNFIEGGRMLFHNGSENTVYNNVLLNVPSGYQPINNSPNYYNQAISTSNSPSPRWRQGALEYGTFTASLEPGSSYNDGNGNVVESYASRYPLLDRWATYMYQRIEEYQQKKATLGAVKASQSSTGCDIESPVSGVEDLNAYLAASRENVYENNVFINIPDEKQIWQYGAIKGDGVAGAGKTEIQIVEDKIFGFVYGTHEEEVVLATGLVEAGHLNPVANNNKTYTSSENPFAGKSYGDASVYTSMGIEAIPFDKIGLTEDAEKPANDKTSAITPVHSAEATVIPNNVSLKWKAVMGAQMYKVEISDDANFSNIVEENTSFEMAYQLTNELEPDTFYYWRVTTIPVAENVTGTEMTSDTFMFKTLSATASTDNFNKFGVTDYKMEDDNGTVLTEIPENGEFKISGYAYNLTGEDGAAEIHIACYDAKGNLIAVKTAAVEAKSASTVINESNTEVTTQGAFSGEFVTDKFTVPGAKTIKLFVWSADGNMIPYSFVKEIK